MSWCLRVRCIRRTRRRAESHPRARLATWVVGSGRTADCSVRAGAGMWGPPSSSEMNWGPFGSAASMWGARRVSAMDLPILVAHPSERKRKRVGCPCGKRTTGPSIGRALGFGGPGPALDGVNTPFRFQHAGLAHPDRVQVGVVLVEVGHQGAVSLGNAKRAARGRPFANETESKLSCSGDDAGSQDPRSRGPQRRRAPERGSCSPGCRSWHRCHPRARRSGRYRSGSC